MRYCLWEVKKLIKERLFLIFMVCCLCLNAVLCFSAPDARKAVKEISESKTVLWGEKVYRDLDANVIGSYYYNERYIHSCVLNQWIKEKYEKLQPSIDKLDAENADLSPFAGEMTPAVHKALFTCQLKALLWECMILITLLGLKSFWIERQTGMVSLVYCSRRGRKTAWDKILANGITGALYCLFLTGVSLALFFKSWNFDALWNRNMASSFHYVIDASDPIFQKPFMTWTSFTLKQYFICSMVLFMGILFAWWLLTNLVALITCNNPYGVIVSAAMICLPLFGLILFPKLQLAWPFYFTTLTLSAIVYCNQWWFTDLGSYSLFAYQEVWTIVLHIVLTAVGLRAGLGFFKRKELR